MRAVRSPAVLGMAVVLTGGVVLALTRIAPGFRAEPAPAHDSPSAVTVDCRTERCEIVLEDLVILSDSADPGLFGERIFVQRDATGRWLTSTITFQQLAVFSATGEFERLIGREGQGPMEFRRVLPPMRAPGDSLYAFDFFNARMTVMNGDHEYVRSVSFPYPTLHPSFIRPDGSFVASGQIQERDAIGYPVHVFDREGRIVRSFGIDVPQYRADMRRLFNRVVGMAADGTVWTVPLGSYRIERWDPETGEMVDRIPRDPPAWFPETAASAGDPRVVRPNPVMAGIWEDSHGFVWLLMEVPAENWSPLYRRGAAPHQYQPGEVEQVFDWVVEVIDPRSGALIATRRFPAEVWVQKADNYFVSLAGMRGEAMLFQVSRPTLIRTEES